MNHLKIFKSVKKDLRNPNFVEWVEEISIERDLNSIDDFVVLWTGHFYERYQVLRDLANSFVAKLILNKPLIVKETDKKFEALQKNTKAIYKMIEGKKKIKSKAKLNKWNEDMQKLLEKEKEILVDLTEWATELHRSDISISIPLLGSFRIGSVMETRLEKYGITNIPDFPKDVEIIWDKIKDFYNNS